MRTLQFGDSWLATQSPSTLKVATPGYLGDCGISSDLASIRKELDRGENQTASAAADAITRINLRDSREKGIAALYELQPTSISRDVLETLFEFRTSLSTETLMDGVGHRNPEVRRIVVKLLRGRGLGNELNGISIFVVKICDDGSMINIRRRSLVRSIA